MPEIKVGTEVITTGKVKEIIINEKGTFYKVEMYEKDAPSIFSNEVTMREKDVVVK